MCGDAPPPQVQGALRGGPIARVLGIGEHAAQRARATLQLRGAALALGSAMQGGELGAEGCHLCLLPLAPRTQVKERRLALRGGRLGRERARMERRVLLDELLRVGRRRLRRLRRCDLRFEGGCAERAERGEPLAEGSGRIGEVGVPQRAGQAGAPLRYGRSRDLALLPRWQAPRRAVMAVRRACLRLLSVRAPHIGHTGTEGRRSGRRRGDRRRQICRVELRQRRL